ncbi:MAG TPA: oxygen-independent coproporphyrinogen III oxidase [Chitinophagales bacterium]|nr:oxygen-independent coproporphyrinogen III oxidase [Chitinophagales bacterium]
MEINGQLISKYNKPVPRYTSYPTVPYWDAGIDIALWQENLKKRFDKYNSTSGISLYIHLPFCESLCSYCGCNKRITTNHKVEEEYLAAIKREWSLYLNVLGAEPVLRELHLGGGTPTFFSPQNLESLMGFLLGTVHVHPDSEFSFEGHPNNTTYEHLEALYNFGFQRVSFGVQDNDPYVQRLINRIQPFENVERAVNDARSLGYKSVNFDLIYGLPGQTLQSVERTMEQVLKLMPDRIAYYSYAHVPWVGKGQRLFNEADLPSPSLKLALYQSGKRILTANGYMDVGMDHFALPTDDLYLARINGGLHRNFMGYTTQNTAMLLGLGVSSISDSGTAFAQNHKDLNSYYRDISLGNLAVEKGYFLTKEDQVFKKYILDIICRGETVFGKETLPLLKEIVFPQLELLAADGLITWNSTGLQVTDAGFSFVRNICAAFDLHLMQNMQVKPQFSKAV